VAAVYLMKPLVSFYFSGHFLSFTATTPVFRAVFMLFWCFFKPTAMRELSCGPLPSER
jgi:hypothetical protein